MYLSPLMKDGEVPEGFFDDPIQDAKVRGIEYKVGIYQPLPISEAKPCFKYKSDSILYGSGSSILWSVAKLDSVY